MILESAGCVAKNKLGYKNAERHFSSGGNLEEALHESNLPADVAFHDSPDLSLPNHVHDLIPSDGPPRRVETEPVAEISSPPIPLFAPRLDSHLEKKQSI